MTTAPVAPTLPYGIEVFTRTNQDMLHDMDHSLNVVRQTPEDGSTSGPETALVQTNINRHFSFTNPSHWTLYADKAEMKTGVPVGDPAFQADFQALADAARAAIRLPGTDHPNKYSIEVRLRENRYTNRPDGTKTYAQDEVRWFNPIIAAPVVKQLVATADALHAKYDAMPST